MLTSNDIQLLVNTIVEKVKPVKVYIFGSYARGEQVWDSDLDILVELESVIDKLETQTEIRLALADCPVAIDIIAVSSAELARYSTVNGYIFKEAISEGKQLYDRARAA